MTPRHFDPTSITSRRDYCSFQERLLPTLPFGHLAMFWPEFRQAVEQMPWFGKVVSLMVPRSHRQTVVFVKKHADLIKDEDWPFDLNKESYVSQFNKPIHVKVTSNIRRHLAKVVDVPADDIE